MKTLVRQAARRLPYLRDLLRERDQLREERHALRAERDLLKAQCDLLWMPAGHFYSPIPSAQERAEAGQRRELPRELPGIDLNEAGQLELFERFAAFYPEQPWTAEPQTGLRYYFENPSYSYSDALCLYGMLRHLRPRRVIEVGSGHSSCVMLDTRERFLGDTMQCTFIEPYPRLLLSLISDDDRRRVTVVEQKLQDVAISRFRELEAGDILFIDSTHVAKSGSDVNCAFATILPALAPGVHVHVHDIFYPFEYPSGWLAEGRAWNEAYVLRAFLQYNERFRIVFFNTFLEHFHRDRFAERMPLCLKNVGGSIWLVKT